MPAEKGTNKSENRRSNKPLMEKRRRARINQSLSELKNLILDAMKKDTSRNSKLEKADILEMAVKHLQNIQKQQIAVNVLSDPNVANKYKAGFNECTNEVSRFLNTVEGIDCSVRGRVVDHLVNCMSELSPETAGLSNNKKPSPITHSSGDSAGKNVEARISPEPVGSSQPDPTECGAGDAEARAAAPTSTTTDTNDPIQVHIPTASSIPVNLSLPQGQREDKYSAAAAEPPFVVNRSSSARSPNLPQQETTTVVHGLQLLPMRLSNGEIVFVVPNQSSLRTSRNATTTDSQSSLSPTIVPCAQSSSPALASLSTVLQPPSASMMAINSSRSSATSPNAPGRNAASSPATLYFGQNTCGTASGRYGQSSTAYVLTTAAVPEEALRLWTHQNGQLNPPSHVGLPNFQYNNNFGVLKDEPVWRPW